MALAIIISEMCSAQTNGWMDKNSIFDGLERLNVDYHLKRL